MSSLQQSPVETPADEGRGRTVALSLDGIFKRYPGVKALDDVSLEVLAGEVHGLVGENGAGKSTLVGVAAGRVHPDEGSVSIAGIVLGRPEPALARSLGLAIVNQEPSLMPDLTVAENLVLGQPVERRPSWRASRAWAREVLAEWTTQRKIDPSTPVRDLSPDARFIVELSKACAQEPKVLILDEPTEHLMADDVETLFRVVRKLTAAGTAVIYISHHLSEVLEVCDRISVLREGVGRGVLERHEATYDGIVARIVGRELDAEFPPKRSAARTDDTAVLKVSDLRGPGFADVSFEVRPGEVLGLAGVEGNGQRELIRALAGVERSRGAVTVDGQRVPRSSTPAAAGAAIAFVPNDRHREGMFKGLSVRENITVGTLGSLSSLGFVSSRAEQQAAVEQIDSMRIATPGSETEVQTLSGGNQQKVVFGRALARSPRVILADEPTQGVDIGARADIYGLIRAAVSDGSAAVVVSSNQAELEGLCDRVLVLSRGRVVEELEGERVAEEAIVNAALTATVVREAQAESSWAKVGRLMSGDLGPPLVTVALTLLLAAYVTSQNSTFLSGYALSSLLMSFAAFAFVSLAQQMVMLVGGIDLSVGPLMGFLGVVASFYVLPGAAGGTVAVGLMLMLVLAIAVASLNFLPTLLGLPPLLTTLVTFTALQGLSLMLRPTPGGQFDTGFLDLISSKVGIVPVVAVVAVVIGCALDVLGRRTTWGVSLRGVGSSEDHAHAVGVRVKLIQCSAYLIAGVLTFMGALLLMQQVGSGNPTAGVSFTLFSITAVVVGGASIDGGRGAFLGALSGAMLLVVINSGVTFLNLSTAWQTYMVGFLTLAAAGIYSYLRRARA